MAEGTRDIVSPWEGFHTQAEAFRERDDERILVLTQMGGRAKTSGVELAQVRSNGAMLWHLRGGKVVRLVNYWDRERALADLGMAPEGDSPPSENVDIVSRCFEAYRASGLDATRSFLHPDFELDQVPGTISPEPTGRMRRRGRSQSSNRHFMTSAWNPGSSSTAASE
jgi:ketosteroid isomerase-like protein